MATVYTRATRAEVETLIRSIPSLLVGLAPDPLGVAQAVQLACGVELLTHIQQSFVKKSRREPSDDGIVWPELAPVTIARKLAKAHKAEKGRKKADRGKNPHLDEVPILIDTGLMLRSFSPGVFDLHSYGPKADFQIFDRLPGRVIVGTNRYPQHHTGIPGRLPKRELWPSDGNLPAVWWEDIGEVSIDALQAALIHILSGGGQVSPVA